MDHQRHAQCLETATSQLRPVGTGRRGQTAAEHVGKVDAAFFDHRSVANHSGASATAGRAGPGVLDEACAAVFGFQRSANAVLQVEQVGFYGLGAGSHGITLNRGKATRR